MTARPDSDQLAELRSRLRGRSVDPSDPGYDDARRVFARRYDDAPALVAYAADVEDVIAAVRHARERGLGWCRGAAVTRSPGSPAERAAWSSI